MKRYAQVVALLMGAWAASAVCGWVAASVVIFYEERIDRAYLDGFRDGGDLVIQEVRKWPTNLFFGSEGKR